MKASSTKTKKFNYMKNFYGLFYIANFRFFCDNQVNVNNSMNEVPSVLRSTVPLIPIRQCSFVLWKTAFGSKVLVFPGLFLLVLIQQISSHLYVYLHKHTLPRSNPSPEPHQRKINDRGAAISSISNFIMSPQVQHFSLAVMPVSL